MELLVAALAAWTALALGIALILTLLGQPLFGLAEVLFALNFVLTKIK